MTCKQTFNKILYRLQTFVLLTTIRAAANIGLPQWVLTCFHDTFVVNQSAVLRLNFCAKNPPLRQAENC